MVRRTKNMSPLAKSVFKKESAEKLPSLRELIDDEKHSTVDLKAAALLALPVPASVDNSKQLWQHYHTFIRENFTVVNVNSIHVNYRPPKLPDAPVLFLNHGAGSSGMTFASLTASLQEQDETIGLVFYDMRGHGLTPECGKGYALDDLVTDAETVLDFVKQKFSNPIYLVGHLLGGAVLAKLATKRTDLQLRGLVMLDIVEETAVESLKVMPQFVRNRPKSFTNLTQAIEWHLRHLLHNPDLAKLLVPHLLDESTLRWKTNLATTQPYWSSWFEGLSSNFLNFSGAKMLILSTHEALDKQLIIGQMQGKYKFVVFGDHLISGHFVHEDMPRQIAMTLLDFVKRNEDPEKFMEVELGFTPKWGGKVHK